MFKWKFLLIRIQTYTINDTKIFERNIRKAPFGGLFLRNQANRHIKNIKNKERMIVMPQKILWFSRHEMSPEQKAALGNDVDIMQINQTINHASELSDEIKKADVIAIVAPIGLQKEFLNLADGKPVIMAKNQRVFEPQPDGEDKVRFRFDGWEQLKKIEVVKEPYNPNKEIEQEERKSLDELLEDVRDTNYPPDDFMNEPIEPNDLEC